MKMSDLKLKDDGGSFDLLLKAAEKTCNGDEELKLQFLTARVIEDLVNSRHEKAMERALLVVIQEEEAFRKEIDGPQFDNLCLEIPKKPSSRKYLKRSLLCQQAEVEGKDADYEQEKMVRKPPLKKRRKTYSFGEKKKNCDGEVGSDPVPDLPQELRYQIEKMKGSDVVMVMQKNLTSTDLDAAQNRLLMPQGKIKNEFLTEEEKNKLERKEGIKTSMIEPCFNKTTDLELKRWKGSGTYYAYVLIGKWSLISHNQSNQLEKDSIVQIWSFRVGSNLHFALVKVVTQ